jgi:hypothetical protein
MKRFDSLILDLFSLNNLTARLPNRWLGSKVFNYLLKASPSPLLVAQAVTQSIQFLKEFGFGSLCIGHDDNAPKE